MGLYAIKPWFVRRLRRVEDALVARGASPDALTAAAVVVSVLGGAAIAAGGALDAPALWLLVPPAVVARLALNALDGSVARRTRRARPFGTALNELGDRMCDAAAIASTAAIVPPVLAVSAVATSFLASGTGVTALALTGVRDNGGPAGKSDRAAMLAVGCAVAGLTSSRAPITIAVWSILVASVATVVARTVRLRRALDREGAAR